MMTQGHNESGMATMVMLAIGMGLMISGLCIGHFIFHVYKNYRNERKVNSNSRKRTS
jgi:hypothetical protein